MVTIVERKPRRGEGKEEVLASLEGVEIVELSNCIAAGEVNPWCRVVFRICRFRGNGELVGTSRLADHIVRSKEGGAIADSGERRKGNCW